jgi:hypothetical protein
MTNLTLNGWKASVAAGVVESLPLQDFESALTLAENFLATQGGWNPDDAGDPTGPGVPVSGVSLEASIVLITVQQLERVYHVDVAANMNFRVVLNDNLAIGLSDEDVLTNIADRLTDVVEANLENTNIELVDIPDFTGTVTNGPTTAEERRAIQTEITGGGRHIAPSVIGLIAARSLFSIDNTYNVEYLYTEPNKVLFIQIAKYTDEFYENFDLTATSKFGISLDAISFKTSSGVIIPI